MLHLKPLLGLVLGVILLCGSGFILTIGSGTVVTVTEVSGSTFSYTAKTRTVTEGPLILQIIATAFVVVGLVGFLLVVVSVYRLIEPEKSPRSHQTTLG